MNFSENKMKQQDRSQNLKLKNQNLILKRTKTNSLKLEKISSLRKKNFQRVAYFMQTKPNIFQPEKTSSLKKLKLKFALKRKLELLTKLNNIGPKESTKDSGLEINSLVTGQWIRLLLKTLKFKNKLLVMKIEEERWNMPNNIEENPLLFKRTTS